MASGPALLMKRSEFGAVAHTVEAAVEGAADVEGATDLKMEYPLFLNLKRCAPPHCRTWSPGRIVLKRLSKSSRSSLLCISRHDSCLRSCSSKRCFSIFSKFLSCFWKRLLSCSSNRWSCSSKQCSRFSKLSLDTSKKASNENRFSGSYDESRVGILPSVRPIIRGITGLSLTLV